MKLNIVVDLDDMWADNESLTSMIKDEIRNAIRASVTKEVRLITQEVVKSNSKIIRETAKRLVEQVK